MTVATLASQTILPVRLHLARKRGQRLQDYSRSINGLKAISVAPPSRWRNIFRVNWYGPRQWPPCGAPDQLLTIDDAIRLYREWWMWNLEIDPTTEEQLAKLRGKNIACYCEAHRPCHGDVLLEIANL